MNIIFTYVMNAFHYGGRLYVVVDMCGFKCAYVSRNGVMQVVKDDLPYACDRLPAADEQHLCDAFMADLSRTLLSPKVLKLGHNYIYLILSDTGITIGGYHDESVMNCIVSNIMHAGGTFWNVISRPSDVDMDSLLSPNTGADRVAIALEWNRSLNLQILEEILQAIGLGPSTSLDVRAAVMDSCGTMEERIAILYRVMLPGNQADMILTDEAMPVFNPPSGGRVALEN